MITFSCSGCGHQYEVPDEYAGKKVRCKKCNTIIIVPHCSPEKSVEETSYQEASSSNKILIFLCFGIVTLILGGFGYLMYSQHTKVRECLVVCEELHADAQIKWDNKDYVGAKDLYKNIVERALEVSSNNKELTSFIEDSKDKIQEAESLLFAEKYLGEIKEKYQQAENLFMSTKMPESKRVYQEVLSFINEHHKQGDRQFSWIFNSSKKKIQLISDIDNIKSEFKYYITIFLKPNSYENINGISSKIQQTNQKCDAIIQELSNISNPTSTVQELIEALKQMKMQLSNVYETESKKARLAADIKKKFEKEQRRLEETEKHQQIDREMADTRIKNAAHALFPKTKETIKSALKSPSTASFEDPTYAVYKTDEDIRDVLVAEWDNQHGDYTRFCQFKKQNSDAVILWFSGKVNAQNSFGAMLQTKWFCIYFYSPSQDHVEFLKYNIK